MRQSDTSLHAAGGRDARENKNTKQRDRNIAHFIHTKRKVNIFLLF
jgi:hypothetical protein